MKDDRQAVTVIDLGVMGPAMAGSSLDQGRRTIVWNLRTGKAKAKKG